MPAPRSPEPPPRIQILSLWPQIDCGRFPVKRTVGDRVDVWADVFRDGHEALGLAIRFKAPGGKWQEAPMLPLGNDRWSGSFEVDRCGRWAFRVTAWHDRVASWQDEMRRKVEAGQEDLESELAEGALLFGRDELAVAEALEARIEDRHAVTESKQLEFRAETFNIFNRANFEAPERDVATASFGQIFNTVQPLAGRASGGPGDPREIQFALRFVF